MRDYIYELLDNIEKKMKSLINFTIELNSAEYDKPDIVYNNLFFQCLPLILNKIEFGRIL